MRQSTRLIINTGATYARMLLTVGIGLYITRAAVHGMGEHNFGIYSLVVGLVSWLNMLSDSFLNSAERFLAYEIGRSQRREAGQRAEGEGAGRQERMGAKWESSANLKRVFASVLVLFVALSAVFVIGGVLVSPWIPGWIEIDPERAGATARAAMWTFLAWAGVTMMVPFRSLMMAHQEFVLFTIIEVLDALFRLGAVLLMLVSPWDRLESYTMFLAGESVLVTVICAAACWWRYPEARVLPSKAQVTLLGEMMMLSSWSLLSRLAYRLRMSGPTTLLGVFYGATFNAAYGVANQAAGYQMQLAGALSRTSRPAIIQATGAGNMVTASRLALLTSKYSTWMVVVLMVPLFIETPIILALWLRDVPEWTQLFLRIACGTATVQWLVCGHEHAIFGSGKVKGLAITAVCCEGLAFLAAMMWAWKLERSPQGVLVCVLAGVTLYTLMMAMFLGPRHGLKFSSWIATVVWPIVLTTAPAAAAGWGMHTLLAWKHEAVSTLGAWLWSSHAAQMADLLQLTAVSAIFGMIFVLLIWCVGLAGDERAHFRRIAGAFSNRLFGLAFKRPTQQ